MDSNRVTNNYLKGAIEELSRYLSGNDDVPRDKFAELINELKVSNLIIPCIIMAEKLNYQVLSDEDEDLLPLFTDKVEFERFSDNHSDYDAAVNDIGFYVELVKENDLGGVLINPGSDDFLIEKELFLELPLNTGTAEEKSLNAFSAGELLEISKNADNAELEGLIGNDADFESLMLGLSESTLFNLILAPGDMRGVENNGIVKLEDISEYSHCTLGDEREQYGVLFTSTDKIKDVLVDDADNYYYQIALLDDYMEFILKSDMAGIIINPGHDDVIIPRASLHEAHLGLTYNNPNYAHATDYMFRI